MFTPKEGGCLCGACRFHATAPPPRTTICHCRFCQRTTGAAYLVEPIFDRGAITVIKGTPKEFVQTSKGSGKAVHLHFCANCGGRLFLTFERFPDIAGVFAGAFDDPNWFEINPENSKHIFLGVARHDSILPSDTPLFTAHAMTPDDVALDPMVLSTPASVGSLKKE